MKKRLFYIFTISIILYSCSTQKYIPEGQYLLDNFEIKADDKRIDKVELESYVRQIPNSSLPLVGKLRLKIYNMAGKDTTWITRFVRKLGEAPIVYNPAQTSISAQQIQKELANEGFLNAQVDTVLSPKNKAMKVTYNITAGTPYTIRKYELDSANIPGRMYRALSFYNRRSAIKPGMLLDQNKLGEEQTQLTTFFRNIGYYSFSKEYMYHKVDTTLNSHQADVFLSLYPEKDSLAFHRYNVRNTVVRSGFDPTSDDNEEIFSNPDTVSYEGMTFIYGKNKFLRKSTLHRNTLLRPGRRYSDMLYSRTFSAFSSMGVVKQTNIELTPIPTQDSIKLVDVFINISPANTHWFQVGVEGTNSAGDLGIAPNISYQHQNLFNGGEVFSVKLKGAYEFISGKSEEDLLNNNYYEFGFDVGLSFPQFLFPWLKKSWREQPTASTQFSVGLNNQHRPEYTRQFFNATITYRWSTLRNRLRHTLDFFDLNYIRMPWYSDEFWEKYINNPTSTMLSTMYQDQLIARSGYTVVYTKNTSNARVVTKSYTIRGGLDVGGLLPLLITSFSSADRDEYGQKKIMGIPFAQYWKVDLSFAQTHTFRDRNSLAYRIGFGIGNPYGTSIALPFEKSYFAGGANSVRGWSTRRLGPGSYKPKDGSEDFINQVGDIKLDMGIEYRMKASSFIELAAFADAGNVWTIREYDDQPGGLFKFSNFYKEIALSYGLGLRFDLGFLLLRLDAGMKAYDPSKDEGKDRWVITKPNFGSNFAWHFAIGYPF